MALVVLHFFPKSPTAAIKHTAWPAVADEVQTHLHYKTCLINLSLVVLILYKNGKSKLKTVKQPKGNKIAAFCLQKQKELIIKQAKFVYKIIK